MFDECATMLRDLNVKKGVLSRLGLGKAKAPDGLNDYTAACSGLANILQVRRALSTIYSLEYVS